MRARFAARNPPARSRPATRLRSTLAVAIAAALAVAACNGEQPETPGPTLPTALGELEGELNLIAWDGYVERAWVTPFEEETGCIVNPTLAGSADEMVSLLASGEHDGLSASGYITNRLIDEGAVAPINLTLVPNYGGIFEGLRGRPHNTTDGFTYGVPHGRGANVLMWRTDIVAPAPESWSAVFDPDSPYAGRVTAYDAPIAIADAAVYLMTAQPELQITNPYALDDRQFSAAVDLLRAQREIVGRHWSLYTDAMHAFTDGDAVLGTSWQVIRNLLVADGVPVEVTMPVEGATGWSDTWMLASGADHPNCMYAWMDHILSPDVNAAAAVYFGEAPVSAAACERAEQLSPGHCATYHAADEEYFSKVYYWSTPRRECGDERGAVCADYAEWVQAWAELRG